MKITVWTEQPNYFIRKVRVQLHEQGKDQAATAVLLDGRFDGERVTWTNLTESQFCAVEDMAVYMSLPYDGSQQ
jgi:hypothetical protein